MRVMQAGERIIDASHGISDDSSAHEYTQTRARARTHTHTHKIRSWTIGPSAKVYVQKPCPLAQDDGLVACLQPQHYPRRHLSIFRHSLAPT